MMLYNVNNYQMSIVLTANSGIHIITVVGAAERSLALIITKRDGHGGVPLTTKCGTRVCETVLHAAQ